MVEAMSAEDLVFIATSLFPTMDKIIVQKMVTFNNKVVTTVFVCNKIASVICIRLGILLAIMATVQLCGSSI